MTKVSWLWMFKNLWESHRCDDSDSSWQKQYLNVKTLQKVMAWKVPGNSGLIKCLEYVCAFLMILVVPALGVSWSLDNLREIFHRKAAKLLTVSTDDIFWRYFRVFSQIITKKVAKSPSTGWNQSFFHYQISL